MENKLIFQVCYRILFQVIGLALLYLSVSLQVLPDRHSLLDEVVQILWQVRGQTLGLEDPQNFVASDKTYLGNTMGVPQNNT